MCFGLSLDPKQSFKSLNSELLENAFKRCSRSFDLCFLCVRGISVTELLKNIDLNGLEFVRGNLRQRSIIYHYYVLQRHIAILSLILLRPYLHPLFNGNLHWTLEMVHLKNFKTLHIVHLVSPYLACLSVLSQLLRIPYGQIFRNRDSVTWRFPKTVSNK